MALQDLTPQLRTRLSRMERAVGWFVTLATAMLVFGFAYYVYTTAQRKGWFKTRAPFFTLVDRATGLRVGDPVMLMGFEVGQITRIEPMPPWEFYNVYVEFEIREPNYGYLWTVGSRARVTTADFLGKRVLEVTKGTEGCPIYIFNPMQEFTMEEADGLSDAQHWKLAEDVYLEDAELAMPVLTPLFQTNLTRLRALGRTRLRAFDSREERKFMTAIWHDREGRYEHYTRTNKPYWLRADESPAVTERLEKLVSQVELALPGFFALTNQIGGVLANTVSLTSNLNALAAEARPAATNLSQISSQLREPGGLGVWLLGTETQRQVGTTLESAHAAIAHADTNLTVLVENLARSLDNLAEITGSLNAQVQANTNILETISKAVVDANDLVEGLKRHWLLRSAFRGQSTNTPPALPDHSTPRGREQFPR
ncbi:MAG: MCE family protein [Verrucomicrobiae bacterium]|nr:MCE family protein [Verrucomicrobiae bacterium]